MAYRLGPGKPYSQKLVDEDRSHILARYLALGYLSPAFRATATALKGQPHQLSVVYQITEGPEVKVAEVITVGRQHTRPRVDRPPDSVQDRRSAEPERDDEERDPALQPGRFRLGGGRSEDAGHRRHHKTTMSW